MKLELMPVFWLALTLVAYVFSRWIYRRTGRYLLSPLILVPALLLAVAVSMHTAYAEYATDTHWLMLVLGPVTVAFAVPIWQQRRLLARHWPALLLGMVAGSVGGATCRSRLRDGRRLDSRIPSGGRPAFAHHPSLRPMRFDLVTLNLVLAIAAEVVGTLSLKASDGFSRLWPSVAVVVGYGLAFTLLAFALKTLYVGPAYALWAGLGTVGAALGDVAQ